MLERHEWWIGYGLDLRGFVPGRTEDGVVHWMADAYAHQEERAALIRGCDLIVVEDAPARTPGEGVSCMACMAASCNPIMMGGTS